ncbi:Protein of unknown function [Roseivivax halotolerans]|jgi:hypothetical protein|uniref:DUF2948 domain-containing protein n=1 Tax=Roseivivax halotolerans TaxID=93684 RepID=A0A1I5ZHF1_9RHOB|nr:MULTISPECIES: DUF2948 family protein [Roseivivax]QFT62542.1 hypothetical protein FIU91_06350 [Roseivivax sp. THAF30]SFQ55865.1 Protein of unknown function [Roseivivax halotolerans]
MSEDARFEDAGPQPLNLGAMDPDDLAVLSALAQDAVLPVTEIAWRARDRQVALLINRLRHEDRTPEVERVQSLLVVENALHVSSQGIDRSDRDMILQILTITFAPGDDGSGAVEIAFAGDGAIRVEVEALELRLKDVTRPYRAPSGKRPQHPE